MSNLCFFVFFFNYYFVLFFWLSGKSSRLWKALFIYLSICLSLFLSPNLCCFPLKKGPADLLARGPIYRVLLAGLGWPAGCRSKFADRLLSSFAQLILRVCECVCRVCECVSVLVLFSSWTDYNLSSITSSTSILLSFSFLFSTFTLSLFSVFCSTVGFPLEPFQLCFYFLLNLRTRSLS